MTEEPETYSPNFYLNARLMWFCLCFGYGGTLLQVFGSYPKPDPGKMTITIVAAVAGSVIWAVRRFRGMK